MGRAIDIDSAFIEGSVMMPRALDKLLVMFIA